MANLDGARARIKRAVQLREELYREFDAFSRNGAPHRLTPEDGNNEGCYFSVHREIEIAPVSWAILIGDLVHNLRAALDYIVFERSSLPDNSPNRRRLQFPFCNNDIEFEKHRKAAINRDCNANLGGISPAFIDLIESCQPYHAGRQPLGWLNDISNYDKHRALQVIMVDSNLLRIKIEERGKPAVILEPGDQHGPYWFVGDGKITSTPARALFVKDRVEESEMGVTDITYGFEIIPRFGSTHASVTQRTVKDCIEQMLAETSRVLALF